MDAKLPTLFTAATDHQAPREVGTVRFACGLEVALLAATGAGGIEVRATQLDVAHVCHHLGLEPAAVWCRLPTAGWGAPARFRVLRQDDHGNRFEVARVTSSCEAAALVDAYTSRLHHQIYWWEAD